MALLWCYRGGGFNRRKCVFVTVVIDKCRLSQCSRVFAGVREVVAALKLEVSTPFRFGSDDRLRGHRWLVATPELAVSAPFRFVGPVATLNVTTLTVDAGCRGAKTSTYGTISLASDEK